MDINIVWWISDKDIPSGLPKRICIRSILLLIFDTKTIPKAKKHVNTNPMTVSYLTLDFCLINPMSATDPTPKIKAPKENGTPRA